MSGDDLDRLRAELFTRPGFRAAYEKFAPQREIASLVLEIRTVLGISQRELARRAGVTQPEIARIEAAEVSPTWATLRRILASVGATVDINLVDKDGKPVRHRLEWEDAEQPRKRRRKAAGA